jgi:hypothetical protein
MTTQLVKLLSRCNIHDYSFLSLSLSQFPCALSRITADLIKILYTQTEIFRDVTSCSVVTG